MKTLWSKLKKTALVAAIVLFAIAVACFFAACNSGDDNTGREHDSDAQSPTYTLTFVTNGGTTIDPITAEAGKAITPPAAPQKDGYVFDGWFTSSDLSGNSVEIPSVMPEQSVTHYARYALAYTVTYNFNLTGISSIGRVLPDEGKAGATITLKDGAAYRVKGYAFLGWTLDKNATFVFTGGTPAGQYEAGDEFVLGEENVTLYAKWAKEYTPVGGQKGERILIYEPLIGHGLGAAIRVCEGKENKLGFAEIDAQNDLLKFTFYYEQADGGNVIGHIDANGVCTLCDETYGSYLMYDYATQEVAEYLLTSDGYGLATITRMVGNQTSVFAYGKYEYNKEYDDYLFTSLDPITQEEDGEVIFYFVCDHQTVEGTELDGYFIQQGYESGSYLLYINGELYNYRLDLNGYGGARLYAYDAVNDKTTLESSGTYRGTDEYVDEYGEWEYVPASGSGFRFVLNVLSDTSGNVPVYIEYDPEMNVTLNAQEGDATLYLDGYGNALYTAGSEEYVGNCVLSQSHALLTFVPYIPDGEGGHEAGGKMYFNVDWSERTFTVNTTGFVIDDTVLTFYEGEGRVVVIPSEVTEIADGAFNYTRTEVSLVSVTISANVTKIGKIAFQNNYSLERAIFLSETPIEIDWSAENNPFRWPAGNFVIVVPEGTQEAYMAAWSDCPYAIKGSVEVTLLPEFEIEDGVLVRYNKQSDAPDILDLTIPDEVTEIANNVFRGLDYIRSVDLNNVTKIGDSAFENCINLKKVIFTSVQEIGEAAFAGCYYLAYGAEYGDGTIELPEIVTIGANAFHSCESVKTVRLGENLAHIGDKAFSECHIYEEEEALRLELLGDTPPQMGVSVGLGNIAMRIIVKDIEVAKSCFADGNWKKYCKHLYIKSGDEKGKYMDGAFTLDLDGRAVLTSSEVLLYEISGESITFYSFDSETAQYETFEGTIISGVITVMFWDTQYVFEKVVGDVTYTSTDGNYTLVCNPSVFDPASYESTGYNGTATVLFNGVETTLKISGYNSKIIAGYTDEDGKVYNFTITLTHKTFTYEKVRNEYISDISCDDGSVLTIHYIGNYIYVYGELKIVTSPEAGATLPAWSEGSTFATFIEDGVYEFIRPFRNVKYKIRITLSQDKTTFTYTYEII